MVEPRPVGIDLRNWTFPVPCILSTTDTGNGSIVYTRSKMSALSDECRVAKNYPLLLGCRMCCHCRHWGFLASQVELFCCYFFGRLQPNGANKSVGGGCFVHANGPVAQA